jgi:type I restriction enzyme, S subunit
MKWNNVPLESVLQFVRNGMNVKQDKSGGGLPITRIETISNGTVDGNRVGFANVQESEAKGWLLSPGDILFSHINSFEHVGKCALYEGKPEKLVHGMNLLCLRGNPVLVDARYLLYSLRSKVFRSQLERFINRAVNQASVSTTNLKPLEIPLPPLPEQKRIAAILDAAEALREKRRQAIAKIDGLVEAAFVDLFGDPVSNPKNWNRIPMAELLSAIESGDSPVCLNRPVHNGEWGVLKLGAITWCKYDPTQNKALTSEHTPDPRLEVKSGDLLFSRKNTYDLVAACAFVRETPPRLLLPDLIFRLRLREKSEVEPEFLHRLLIHPSKRREIQKLAGGSSGSMPNISKANLLTVALEIPPVELQRHFVQTVRAVEKLRDSHLRSLVDLDSLFTSLQHRAFRGEL